MSWRITIAAGLGTALLALTPSALAHRPIATAAGTCGVGSGEGYGYAYLDALSVTRTSCATGKTLVRHKGRLKGWHCNRKVLQKSSDQLVARESCTSGRRGVKYTYSQNT